MKIKLTKMFVFVLSLALPFFAACSDEPAEGGEISPSSSQIAMSESISASPNSGKEQNVIRLDTPLPISQNQVGIVDDSSFFVRARLADGNDYNINIEMTEGSYSYLTEGEGIYGNNLTGSCQVRVYTEDESGKQTDVFTAPISIDGGAMTFGAQETFGEFSLAFDDYNNDGNPDFTLGQYGGSNGNLYKLFTVYPNGEVKELDTGGPMFISWNDFSIPLTKESDASFSIVWYNNSYNGGTADITTVFEWDGDKFVIVSEKADRETGNLSNPEIVGCFDIDMLENSPENQAYVDKYINPFTVTGIFNYSFSPGNVEFLFCQ